MQMLCDICHKREATVHLTEIINDQVSKMHLCEECAREKSDEMESHFGLSDLLAGLSDIGTSGELETKKGAKCDFCGSTFSDFQRVGRLGCPKCYETFKSQLAPLLRRIHGQDHYMGKLPVSKTVSAAGLSKDAKDLRALKAKLQDAISLEEFEQAAGLRDEIKKIEEKFRKKEKEAE